MAVWQITVVFAVAVVTGVSLHLSVFIRFYSRLAAALLTCLIGCSCSFSLVCICLYYIRRKLILTSQFLTEILQNVSFTLRNLLDSGEVLCGGVSHHPAEMLFDQLIRCQCSVATSGKWISFPESFLVVRYVVMLC